jgi:hypothetical protein
VSTESIVIIGGVVGAIVAGMFSRIAGAVAGLLLVAAMLGWGAHVYSEGRALSFFGSALSPPAFYGAIGALGAYEVLSLFLALRARKRQKAERSACPACGAIETEEAGGRFTCRRCQHTWN